MMESGAAGREFKAGLRALLYIYQCDWPDSADLRTSASSGLAASRNRAPGCRSVLPGTCSALGALSTSCFLPKPVGADHSRPRGAFRR